jgi:hypothetical protein
VFVSYQKTFEHWTAGITGWSDHGLEDGKKEKGGNDRKGSMQSE